MAISQRVQLLSDNAQGVSILLEYLKNPKLVDQLTEDIKKLNALTEQEEQKAAAARSSVITYEGLKQQQEKLDANKAAHEKTVVDFQQVKSDHAAEIDKQKAGLSEREFQLGEIAKQHTLNAAKIEKDRADLLGKYDAAFAELTLEKAALEKTKSMQDVRATELAKAEQAIKEKAERLKGLLAE